MGTVRSLLNQQVTVHQINPKAPATEKQIVSSNNGGVGAEPTVSHARSDQRSTATKPIAVARRRVMM
jgi:hypothetical protein